MKNYLPCEIVKDLLPGYIEGLSSKETSIAVENHLSECQECKAVANNMMNEESNVKSTNEMCENDDKQLFKKIKKRLNRKTKVICGISIAIVIIAISSFYALFSAPIKKVNLSDVKVSATVYPVSELEKNAVSEQENGSNAGDSDNVKISAETDDNSETFQVTIPDINNDEILITGSTLKKTKCVTTVSWSCPFFLREIKYDSDKNEESTDTIYVSAFKTTVLGNKAQEYQSKMTQLEFRKINKIVFVDDGQETILWKNNKKKK